MVKKFLHFSFKVILQFYRDGCFSRAASLAYTTLLSMVPLLTISFRIIKAFPMFEGLAQQMQDFIFDNFVAQSAKAIQTNLEIFISQTDKLSIWSMFFLFIIAVLLVFSVEQAFNSIWRVKKRREDISAFLIYWGVITFVPIAFGVGLTAFSYLLSLPFVSNSLVAKLGITKSVLYLAPYLTTYLAFTVLYQALPNCKVPIKSSLIAALPVTILFEMAKLGFTFYVFSFATYQLIYGALAIIPIFLVWLYISWLIVLFGAVISYVHSRQKQRDE